MKLTTNFHHKQVAEIKNGVTPTLPTYAFIPWTGTTLDVMLCRYSVSALQRQKKQSKTVYLLSICMFAEEGETGSFGTGASNVPATHPLTKDVERERERERERRK